MWDLMVNPPSDATKKAEDPPTGDDPVDVPAEVPSDDSSKGKGKGKAAATGNDLSYLFKALRIDATAGGTDFMDWRDAADHWFDATDPPRANLGAKSLPRAASLRHWHSMVSPTHSAVYTAISPKEWEEIAYPLREKAH